MSRGSGGFGICRDQDARCRFLSLVSEFPERFGAGIHALLLMDTQYHLLMRCRCADLSQTLRWQQTIDSVHFNWAYPRRGLV